jgi:hypothetical protein
MTATDELARDEATVTLAREIRAALLRDVADQIEAEAERADSALAGRTMAPTPVAYKLIDACRLIAAYARGQAATP